MKQRIAIIAGVIVLVGLSAAGALAWMNRAEPFNDRDVSFASNMVPHHVGALEMAEVILAKEGIPAEVQDLPHHAPRVGAGGQDPRAQEGELVGRKCRMQNRECRI